MEQEETYALVVLPEFTSFPITSDELPEKVGGLLTSSVAL